MPGVPAKVALRIEQDTPCPDCGYNLRGLRLDGRCPECGRPTVDTFARPLRASTGALAEDMIRRAGRLMLVLLAWWWAYRWLAWHLPPRLGQAVLLAATLLCGTGVLIGILEVTRLFRRARGGHVGSSKPLQDIAGLWMCLCWAAVVGGLTVMALPWVAPPVSGLLATLLMLGSVAAAGGAQLLAGHAAVTVLRRSALESPLSSLIYLAAAVVTLVGAGVAPPPTQTALALAQVAVVLASTLLRGVALWVLIGRLQEAQGSVVSIGRRSRR